MHVPVVGARAADASTAAREADARRPGAGRRAATRIRFSVSVPVLSVQMTVVSPSVSTASSRRTIAPRRQRPCAERERRGHGRREPLGNGGHRDGDADEERTVQGLARAHIAAPRATVRTTPSTTIWRVSRASRRSSGVGGGFALGREGLDLPRARCSPVAQTSARPWPARRPFRRRASRRARRAASARSTGSTLLCQPAATLPSAPTRPLRALASTTRASAATRSPSATRRTSPGTTSSARSRARPVAHDGRGLGEGLRERQDRALGHGLLPEAERGVHDEHGRDRCRLDGVADRERDSGRGDQQRDQRIEELVEGESQVGGSPYALRPVGSEVLEPASGVDRGQSAIRVGLQGRASSPRSSACGLATTFITRRGRPGPSSSTGVRRAPTRFPERRARGARGGPRRAGRLRRRPRSAPPAVSCRRFDLRDQARDPVEIDVLSAQSGHGMQRASKRSARRRATASAAAACSDPSMPTASELGKPAPSCRGRATSTEQGACGASIRRPRRARSRRHGSAVRADGDESRPLAGELTEQRIGRLAVDQPGDDLRAHDRLGSAQRLLPRMLDLLDHTRRRCTRMGRLSQVDGGEDLSQPPGSHADLPADRRRNPARCRRLRRRCERDRRSRGRATPSFVSGGRVPPCPWFKARAASPGGYQRKPLSWVRRIRSVTLTRIRR